VDVNEINENAGPKAVPMVAWDRPTSSSLPSAIALTFLGSFSTVVNMDSKAAFKPACSCLRRAISSAILNVRIGKETGKEVWCRGMRNPERSR